MSPSETLSTASDVSRHWHEDFDELLPSPPRKLMRIVNGFRVDSTSTNGTATTAAVSRRSSFDDPPVEDPRRRRHQQQRYAEKSPPKIGVSPDAKFGDLRQPEAAPAVAGQYDFTWLESPAPKSSPRNVYDGKSLFGLRPDEDDDFLDVVSLGFEPRTPLVVDDEVFDKENLPSPPSTTDPHLALLGLLWPSTQQQHV